MHHQTLVQLRDLFERGVKCAKVGAARNMSKVVHHRQPYEHHVLVCKQHIQVPFGDSVGVPSIDIYIYIYAACQVPTLLGVTIPVYLNETSFCFPHTIIVPTAHLNHLPKCVSLSCSVLRPWLLVFLAWPFLVHTVRTPQSFLKEIFLKGILADDTISKGNEGVEKRHEHEHGRFKKFKRSPAINFPDGGDHDGGSDNIKKFKRVTDSEDTIVVKARRSAAIDFLDGGDSDRGVGNIKPPPTNISKRIPEDSRIGLCRVGMFV
jgi:hypothetical protein